MNAVTGFSQPELVDDTEQFFAPVSADLVDGLVGQYQSMRGRIEAFAEQFQEAELSPVLGYFFDGGMDRSWHRIPDLSKTFKSEGAVAALNSEYWQRALSLTDVYEAMPQKRRDEWNDQIREHKCPDFEEETVRATLEALLVARSKFFAERVDGIFRALSGTHVTNRPEGFGKRMIMYVRDNIGLCHTSNEGHLSDLRKVIAKFMGRMDEPGYLSSKPIIDAAYTRVGQWMPVDGGTLRIRVYLKGTAHLEVHPDMAWRLNHVLASLYPAAIPSSFRTKPKRKPRNVEPIQRPLPFAVVSKLASMRQAVDRREEQGLRGGYPRIRNALQFDYSGSSDKHVIAEAESVLMALGAVKVLQGGKLYHYQFDYDPTEAMAEVVASGCIPDQKTHQFYPTPEWLAEEAVKLASIGAADQCLEPSAGTGALADQMPMERTHCVELSSLHCSVLSSKGYAHDQADFLEWSEKAPSIRFDRVVMNPPFKSGQWQAHLEAAFSHLNPGGRLVAILPSSAKKAVILGRARLEWSQVYDRAFTGASISVVILVAHRLQ